MWTGFISGNTQAEYADARAVPGVVTNERNYIWVIRRDDDAGYDEYDSAVVVAKDAVAACFVHPGSSPFMKFAPASWSHSTSSWVSSAGQASGVGTWVPPTRVTAERIGVADDDYEAGAVICASFNAG